MSVVARRRRIVMTLDSAEFDSADLERVSRLAERLNAEIEAVFVEDIDVLGLADLPFLREYRFASMRMEGMNLERLETELRAAARRAERALAEQAALRGVPWRFRVWRGSLENELLGALEADVLALSRLGVTRRRGTPVGHPIAVCFDGSEPARRALQTAVDLAKSTGVTLTVILYSGSAADAADLEGAVAEACRDADVTLNFERLADLTAAALGRIIEDTGTAVLVLPRDHALVHTGSLRDCLESLRCVLFLVT